MYANLSHGSFAELGLKSSGSPFRFPKDSNISNRYRVVHGFSGFSAFLAFLAFLAFGFLADVSVSALESLDVTCDVEINGKAMGAKRK